MIKRISALALSFALLGGTMPVRADDELNTGKIKHVLLISVDGFHALDLSNYVKTHSDSTLAALSSHGFTYTNAATTTPSDSFPGLASLVTGGSPVTAGFWYDDTYNRKLSPPMQTDGLGNPGGNCPGTIGTNVAWDEAIDIDLTKLDGGGGINPKFLVRDPANNCCDNHAPPISPREYHLRGRQVPWWNHRLDRQAPLLRVDQRPQR